VGMGIVSALGVDSTLIFSFDGNFWWSGGFFTECIASFSIKESEEEEYTV